jgi:hypothetical protein
VIVAERDRGPRGPQIIGLGRMTKTDVDDKAEPALIVEIDWQNDGDGTALL